jgi:capsular exopolysaccharide synthesis family protein
MDSPQNATAPGAASFEPPSEASPHNEAVFDLTDLLRIVRVRQKIIFGTAITVVVLATIVLFNLTPLYDATALVMLDQRQNKVEDVGAVLSGLATDPTSIENQVQILRSRSLMSRVIDKLHLDEDSEFGVSKPGLFGSVTYYLNPVHWFGPGASTVSDEQKAQEARNKIIDRLLSRLDVVSVGRSSAIRINFESASAEKAERICNAIADAYAEDQLNAKFDATQKATSWLADRIQQLSNQVQAADAAVQQYKAENGITETAGGGSIIDQQTAALSAQLITARSDLAEQEAKYSRVSEMQKSGHSADISEVVGSPLIAQLRGQESDLIRQEGELSSKYGPRHPKMLDIEAQKRNLDSKIDEEVQRVVQTVANDVAVARARVGSLQASLNGLEGASSVQGKAKIKLSQLEAAATSSRSLYEAFLGRFKEAEGQEGIQTPDARIISRAEIPVVPSFPNKLLTFGVAIPGGLLLGFVLAMLAERLDAGFRTTAQIERLLGVPVLTTLPEIARAGIVSENAADRVIDKPMSSFAEAVRGLRMGLVMSNVDKRPKVVLVTSSVPDEGKTTVAISLARLAARTGEKVILIDGDLRRPSVAKSLSLPPDCKGILDLLTGDAWLEQCVSADPRSTAHILTAAKGAASPPDLLGSITMSRLINGLRSYYDLIVIDSAPLLPVNDTKILAQIADAVVFVVRWERTPRDAVVMGARHLMDVKAPVAGIVLSRADIERYKYYSYGYQDYYSYNKYYTD